MAKRNRETKLRERRMAKEAKKAARKEAAAEGGGLPEADAADDAYAPVPGERSIEAVLQELDA